MNIDSITNGIVIDHIQAKKGLEIYNALKLGQLDCSVAIITNAKSKKMGKKDIIKIDRNIDLDLDILGYLDPNITINIIKCKNPRCITSTEKELDHVFILADKDKRTYRCKYCETLSEE